jgi:two-component sensor histidine kinase
MQALLDYASYAPHGYCLFWQPWLVALHVAADLLIAASYFAIPFALVIFLRRRPDLKYRGLVALFAAFILLCGVTHLISLITLWIPIYPIQGLIKLLTGVVSAVTAVVLFLLVPRLAAIPSPHQLETANAHLRQEITAHQETLGRLREAQRTLEAKVEERTAELTEANRKLGVLTREAVHRGQNLLAVVTSIARQTARGGSDLNEFLGSFMGRIRALANATATVAESHDHARATAQVRALVLRQLEPVMLTFGDRVRVSGPDVDVNADAAQHLSLALHELATNAQKRGALAGAAGTVDVTWSLDDVGGHRTFTFHWKETGTDTRGGETATKEGHGFGDTLLSSIVPTSLGGVAMAEARDGYAYQLQTAYEHIAPDGSAEARDASITADPTERIWGLAT